MDNGVNGQGIAISLKAAQAIGLARQGKTKEAQLLLGGDRAIPDDDLSLEVLAGLATADGDYLRGLRLWELLLQRNPQHAEARRMVHAIEVWLARPTWAKFVPLGAATAAALAVAVVLWALVSSPSEPVRPASLKGSSSPAANVVTATTVTRSAPPPPTTSIAPEPAPMVSFPSAKAAKPKR